MGIKITYLTSAAAAIGAAARALAVIIAAAAAAIPEPAAANGDPVSRLSAVMRVSNPEPRDIAEIRINAERLFISPRGRYTDVTVEYTLENTSDKDFQDIDYGFPIDYYGEGDAHIYDNGISESAYMGGWSPRNIRNVTFSIDGRALPYTLSDAAVITAEQPLVHEVDNVEIETREYSPAVCRRWAYTSFDIGPRATAGLKVTYSVLNSYGVPLYRSSHLPEQYNIHSDIAFYFRYDFSPAAHWGDGRIRLFSVEVDTSAVTVSDDSRHIRFYGLPLEYTEGNRLTYRTTDFDLTAAEPLEMEFSCRFSAEAADLLARRVAPDKYSVEVPSALKKHAAANLSDMRPESCCTMQADGDRTIRLKFKRPTAVKAVAVLCGCRKNETAYRSCARPKTITRRAKPVRQEVMEVRHEYTDGYDDGTGKAAEWTEPVYDYTNRNDTEYASVEFLHEIEVNDIAPSESGSRGLLESAVFIAVAPAAVDGVMTGWTPSQEAYDLIPPVEEIALTVTDTYKGTQSDDICISEIIVFE